jgi:hypothetical protein
MVNRGAVGPLVGDDPPQPVQPRAPRLPTGVPDGVEEALRSVRSGRPTRHVPPRRGHEDHPPLGPHGFETPPAIRVAAQGPLTVLIKRVRRPSLQGHAAQRRRPPLHPVRHPQDRATRQRRWLNAHHAADRAEAGEAAPTGEAPGGRRPDVDGAIGLGRAQWPERLDRDGGAGPRQRPAVAVPPRNTGGFQPAIRVEPAAPSRAPPGQDPAHVLRPGPGVAPHDAHGHLAPDGRFHAVDGQGDGGATRRRPRPTRGGLAPPRGDRLLPARPRLGLPRDRASWTGLGPRGVPLRELRRAALAAPAPGDASRAPDGDAGHRVMGQGGGASPVVRVAVHVGNAAAPRVAPGILPDHPRRPAAPPMGRARLEPAAAAPAIAGVLPPGGLRKHAGAVGVLGPGEDATGDVGHPCVGQDDQPGHIGRERPKLARVVTPIAEDRRLVGNDRGRPHHGPFPSAPPGPSQRSSPGPRVAAGFRHGTSQLPS